MQRLLVAAPILVILATPATGQTVTGTTGALIGTVTDSTKAVLPGGSAKCWSNAPIRSSGKETSS
jgi:hypothetical protein